ncbi:MAG: hypothetical protein KA734_00950 [Fluviicola sp.]|nr:hypothetical protein [Fluviicola sp.]
MLKKRKKINFFVVILLLMSAVACRKDKPQPCSEPNGIECLDFKELETFQGITFFSHERFQFQSPCFNPNNPNEFVYNYKDFELDEFQLVKFNISTGIKTILANNVKIISQPKWSRKGWIAFDNVFEQNYQLWIVKDNGDSLTQKSVSGGNISPAWDSEGENLFWLHSPNKPPSYPYYFFKQGVSNTITDTLMRDGDINQGSAVFNEISSQNILLTNTIINNEIHFAYAPLSSMSFTSIFNNSSQFKTDLIRGVAWSSNSQIAYFTFYNNSDMDGLYKLNINSGSFTKLINFCHSKRYNSISCSSNGTEIVGERIVSYTIKDSDGNFTGQIVENSEIFMIDLVTLKETKINLE